MISATLSFALKADNSLPRAHNYQYRKALVRINVNMEWRPKCVRVYRVEEGVTCIFMMGMCCRNIETVPRKYTKVQIKHTPNNMSGSKYIHSISEMQTVCVKSRTIMACMFMAEFALKFP